MAFIGNFATGTNGDYKIEIPLLAGANFDRKREATLWTFGSHGLYFKYPNLTFFTNTGSVAYNALLDGYIERAYWYYEYRSGQVTSRIVTVVHDVTNQQVRIYADDYLIETIPAALATYVGTFALNTDSATPADAFSGTLGTPTFTANNTNPSIVNTPRVPVYRQDIFPNGYVAGSNNWNNVDNIETQYQTFLLPEWDNGVANSYATGRAIDLKNLAGYSGSGTIPQQVIDRTIWLQDLLANDWGWVYDVSAGNIDEFYQNRLNPNSIARQLITWALAHPPATGKYQYVTAVANTSNIAPYTFYNFFDILYTDPLSIIDGNVQIYRIEVAALKTYTGELDIRSLEDGELLHDFSAAGQLQATQKHTDFYNYLRSQSDLIYASTESTMYRVYDHRIHDAISLRFVPFVTINGTPTNTAPYPRTGGMGTIQQYILTPSNWRAINGNDNGFEFYYAGKWYEIDYGYQLNTPYYNLGQSANVEDYVLCAQGLGYACLLKVMGAKGFVASNFSSGVDARAYFYQCFVAPYVQAACNDYEPFLDSGVLLPGDTYIDPVGETMLSGVYWTGTKQVPCVARKLGSDQYMIGFAYMVTSNYDDQEDEYDFSVTIDGILHTFTARRCGDIFIYNSTSHVYTQLTGHFQLTHFQYWNITPPPQMGLIPRYTLQVTNSQVIIGNITGAYNAISNPNGYGFPNDNDGLAWSGQLFIPDGDFQLTANETTTLLNDAIVTLGYTMSTNNPASQFVFTAADLGMESFTPGWYNLVALEQSNANDYNIDVNEYNDETVQDEIAEIGLDIDFLNTKCCKNPDLANWTTLNGYEFGVVALWESEQYEKAMELLLKLSEKLDMILDTDC